MTTNTRNAFRRELAFDSLADLEAELDKVRAAHHAGTLRTSGNWTAGQILGHLAKWMGWYLDNDIPFQVGLTIRVIARLFKNKLINSPMKPGMSVKPKSGSIGDDPAYDFEEGWDRLQNQLDRVRAGESLDGPNPVLGEITHEQAVRIHLNHAALHLSFLHYDGTPLDGVD